MLLKIICLTLTISKSAKRVKVSKIDKIKLGMTKMSRFSMKALSNNTNKFYSNMFVPNFDYIDISKGCFSQLQITEIPQSFISIVKESSSLTDNASLSLAYIFFFFCTF